MKRNLTYRAVVILVVLVASFFLFYPPSRKINLGLDLKGGIHLVLQVLTDDAFEVEISQMRDRIEDDLEQEQIVYDRTRATDDFGIEILGVLQEQQQNLETYLGIYSQNWTYRTRFRESEVDVAMEMNAAYKRFLADRTVRDAPPGGHRPDAR